MADETYQLRHSTASYQDLSRNSYRCDRYEPLVNTAGSENSLAKNLQDLPIADSLDHGPGTTALNQDSSLRQKLLADAQQKGQTNFLQAFRAMLQQSNQGRDLFLSSLFPERVPRECQTPHPAWIHITRAQDSKTTTLPARKNIVVATTPEYSNAHILGILPPDPTLQNNIAEISGVRILPVGLQDLWQCGLSVYLISIPAHRAVFDPAPNQYLNTEDPQVQLAQAFQTAGYRMIKAGGITCPVASVKEYTGITFIYKKFPQFEGPAATITDAAGNIVEGTRSVTAPLPAVEDSLLTDLANTAPGSFRNKPTITPPPDKPTSASPRPETDRLAPEKQSPSAPSPKKPAQPARAFSAENRPPRIRAPKPSPHKPDFDFEPNGDARLPRGFKDDGKFLDRIPSGVDSSKKLPRKKK